MEQLTEGSGTSAPACLFMGSDLDSPKSASFMTPVEYTSESRSCTSALKRQNSVYIPGAKLHACKQLRAVKHPALWRSHLEVPERFDCSVSKWDAGCTHLREGAGDHEVGGLQVAVHDRRRLPVVHVGETPRCIQCKFHAPPQAHHLHAARMQHIVTCCCAVRCETWRRP